MYFKKLIPNYIKTEIKFWLLKQLKIPYSKYGLPLEILKHLKYNEDGLTLIDIGAADGNFTLAFNKHYKIKIAILVEPIPEQYNRLHKTFPDKNFYVIDKAASNINGIIDFHYNEESIDTSSILKIDNLIDELSKLNISKTTILRTPTITIDTLLEENDSINYIDLLKIDVQGAEHLVLKGCVNSLDKIKYIYTEFSYKPLYQGSSTFIQLYEFLSSYNFMLIESTNGYRGPNDELLQGDALFINKNFI